MNRTLRAGSVASRRLLALLAAFAGTLAACAALPADPEFARDYARDRRSSYRAAVHGEIQKLLREWQDAVARDDVERALALYDADAWVLLDYPAQGPDLGLAVAHWVRGARSVLTGPADFDFSADLAFADVRLLVTTTEGRRRTGSMIVVARRTGDAWKIRSQLVNLPAR